MNQFFNITRFSRLAMYDARINYKKYLIAAAIAFVGICIVSYFLSITYYANNFLILHNSRNWEDVVVVATINVEHFHSASEIMNFVFAFSLTAFLPIFLLLSFPALSSKKSTMNYLLLPASVFEKYFLEFLIRIVVGFGLFLLLFFLASNLVINVIELQMNARFADLVERFQTNIQIDAFSFENTTLVATSPKNDTIISALTRFMIIAYTSVFLCMFSVRTFFNRFSFVKTGAVILTGSFLFLHLFAEIVDGNELSENIIWNFNIAFILIAVICLILGYYTLKRKRV
jgi:hypothetical protein